MSTDDTNAARRGSESNDQLGGSWRSEPAPTHRCTTCGAVWRFIPRRDFPGANCDSWNLRSAVAGPCCDSAPMREQIVPLTMGEVEKLVRARLMVDRMVQQIEGPQADDGVH